MSRRLLFIFILTCAFASITHSFDPPWQRPPYPWGRDTTEWIWKKISSGPTQAYYNPEEEMFYLCGGDPVQWPMLYVELFIEMEMEIDVGNIYSQSTDEHQDFADQWYVHGTAQSDVPALFRILTENEDEINSYAPITGDPIANNDRPSHIEWEISTDGGYSYKELRGDRKIKYYQFDSWFNSFIVKITIPPEKNGQNRMNRVAASIYPLPRN